MLFDLFCDILSLSNPVVNFSFIEIEDALVGF